MSHETLEREQDLQIAYKRCGGASSNTCLWNTTATYVAAKLSLIGSFNVDLEVDLDADLDITFTFGKL